jgi:uncharacterized protein (TIGR03118 family)
MFMKKHLAITAAAGAAVLIGGLIVVGVARAGDDDRSGDRMGFYKQTNLVANEKGHGAGTTVDTNLVNPWGMAWAFGGAAWVSDNGSGKSTLYTGKGAVVPLVVDIPGPGTPPSQGTPTGIVWNPIAGEFKFHDPEDTKNPTSMVSAVFIFAGEDGVISAWSPSLITRTKAVAVLGADGKSGAVYKGLAYGTDGNNFIFATNFASGEVEVYKTDFTPRSNVGKHGKMFHDPQLPKDYAPFGIAYVNKNLFVTFAQRSKDNPKGEEQAGPGLGIVDVFSTDGELVQRFVSNGKNSPLNAPWGVTMATKKFGKFSGAVLIGNFGNGQINAFDYRSGQHLGMLQSPDGKAIVIDGLWSLAFGDFVDAENDDLYFTAGINREAGGLFGEIAPVSGKKD